MKGQALTIFIAKFSHQLISQDVNIVENQSKWKLYVDGSSNEHGSGTDIILESPLGHKLTSAIRFKFKASNTEAKYEAFLASVSLA